jgi:membrane-associated phospholipid phosphatase
MSTVRPTRQRPPVARGWPDLTALVVGLAGFTACALLVHRHHVDGPEATVFRAVNDHTVVPFLVVWPLMQLGNFLVVPVSVLAAAVFRQWRLAASLLVGGLAAYFIAADVVRRLVIRGRPASLLADVHIRGAPAAGQGFVSGHVAVVTSLAAISWPYLPRWGRVAVVAAGALVALARMYVGAHLPLDVVGGAACGLAVAGAVRLVAGRPARARLAARVGAARNAQHGE